MILSNDCTLKIVNTFTFTLHYVYVIHRCGLLYVVDTYSSITGADQNVYLPHFCDCAQCTYLGVHKLIYKLTKWQKIYTSRFAKCLSVDVEFLVFINAISVHSYAWGDIEKAPK